MSSLLVFILIYTIGGLTFPFLLIASIIVHAYFTQPVYDVAARKAATESLQLAEDLETVDCAKKNDDEKFQPKERYETQVAAGYFAVSRDYIPSGINGRPPERTTPIGSTPVSTPSQSVYQSMYRSIFERKPSNGPLDKGAGGKPQKKGSNIFYIVLRHGHLMLFDDDEQLEVRHVISLAHHNISIYSGGDETPEGELFIKRNALCLSRRTDLADIPPDGQASKPFFLFSENCSDKEDFYFSLLRNQENQPKPLQYEIKDIIKLVQKLHSSDEHLHTKWINAVIGRIFLALYKTSEVENFIRSKIMKKISRVKTPAFLSKIALQNVNMGESAPVITNPRLKDLTVNGELVVEADLRYSGNSRIEVAATARIDLGAPFKAREVNLLLAVNIKRIEGHIFLKIKPPPSNRFWMCFQTQPKIDLIIEPIVSSRQITYTLILRQIENRIKEVVAESLVFPNWDDSPFFGTEKKMRRGGIWADNLDLEEPSHTEAEIVESSERQSQPETDHAENEDSLPGTYRGSIALGHEASASVASKSSLSHTLPRKFKPIHNFPGSGPNDSSSSIDTQSLMLEKTPKSLRSGSFPGLSSPVVSTDSVTADTFKSTTNTEHSYAVAAISALSQINSPMYTPEDSPPQFAKAERLAYQNYLSLNDSWCERELFNEPENLRIGGAASITGQNKLPPSPPSPASTNNASCKSEAGSTRSFLQSSRRETSSSSSTQSSSTETRRLSLATMTNAAASATKWGWNALQRSGEQKNSLASENSTFRPLVMGRGQPLPPPGVPLPPPGKKTKTAPIPVSKRKPMSPPGFSLDSKDFRTEPFATNPQRNEVTPPLLPKRKPQVEIKSINEESEDGLLIVPAPVVDFDQTFEEDYQIPVLATGVSSPPRLSSRRSAHRTVSGSLKEDGNNLPSWLATQEQEVRVRSVLTEEETVIL